jgi:hypothetical protein
MGSRAIAIAGPSGAGKSTTSAAFAKLGYPVLSDDVVTVDERDGQFLVHPGFARIALQADSAEALYGSTDELPRRRTALEKHYVNLTEDGFRFQESPLPLAVIYVLDERASDSPASRIESFSGQEALLSLIGNSYATNLMDKRMRAHEFEILRRVIARMPIRRVSVVNDYSALPQLCNMIVEDFEALTQCLARADRKEPQVLRA